MSPDEFLGRLAARASAASVDVSPALAEQLERYYRLLSRWNATINLTALELDPVTDQAIDRLLIEPLAALPYIAIERPVWFDVGSGGGSPAIPLKLARPAFELTMIESRERKAAFLREAVRMLSLEHASVDARRIEDVASSHPRAGSVDLITIRAVRIDSSLIEALRKLLSVEGRIILFGARPDRFPTPDGFRLAGTPKDTAQPFRDIVLLDRDGL